MINMPPPTTLISAVKRSWMVTGRLSRTTGTTDAGVEPVTHASGANTVLRSVPALCDHYRNGAAPMLLMALITLSPTLPSTAESGSGPQPQLQHNAPLKSPSAIPGEPTVTVLDHQEVQSILGKEVRSTADENMGRIVDIIVDRTGRVRAAVVDFGGFLGVGSRKIAIGWNALHFAINGNKLERVTLEWTRDQVRAAPEYRDDKPVVVLEAAGSLEPLPFP
jgi:hypothetical protein